MEVFLTAFLQDKQFPASETLPFAKLTSYPSRQGKNSFSSSVGELCVRQDLCRKQEVLDIVLNPSGMCNLEQVTSLL
jgi:hypothetical protein